MATTKERILAAIDILDDAQLEAVYATIQQFTGEARKDPETPDGTLADLSSVGIELYWATRRMADMVPFDYTP